MTKKRACRDSSTDICKPIAIHVVTPPGLNDLSDIGRRLSLPQKTGEPIDKYAQRLGAALDRLELRERIDGATLFMLRLIVGL